MRLILVRHGAVAPPRPRTFYGGSEVPLSELGRQEAAAAAAALRAARLHHVVCSPLSRALHGAELIAAGRGLAGAPEPVDAFREIHRGRWVGFTQEEILERWPEDWRAHHADPETWRGHAGESLGDLRRRVLAGRDALAARWQGRTLALVAHLYPIRALIADAQGGGYAAWEAIKIPTGSISVLEQAGSSWVVHAQGLRPEEGELLRRFSTDFSTDLSTRGLRPGPKSA